NKVHAKTVMKKLQTHDPDKYIQLKNELDISNDEKENH
ncbi:hypothetical protein MHK_004801, partial [Candidatus Magnetomorum sp. HK-1]